MKRVLISPFCEVVQVAGMSSNSPEHQFSEKYIDIIYDVQSFSGVTTAISCNENFPIRSECDLETSTVIKVQVAKKIYYFFINIVMFFIPILLMTICYSMIVAKLYCSSSPGERLGGVTPQVLFYFYFIFTVDYLDNRDTRHSSLEQL